MYLAVISTSLDDLPIRLTESFDSAKATLETCTQADFDAAYSVLNRDHARVCCGVILRFDQDGKPTELVETVKLPQLEEIDNGDWACGPHFVDCST